LKKLVNDISTELYKNVTPPPGTGAQGDTGSSGQATGETTN
jgi:hypothetical protein